MTTEKTSVQLTPEGYAWLWDERKPGESMKATFDRLRKEMEAHRKLFKANYGGDAVLKVEES